MIVLALCLFFLLLDCTHAIGYNWFKCPSDCSRVMCNHYKTLKMFCKYGTVYDHCGCCQVCAVGLAGVCGGVNDIYGKCGAGLYCYPVQRRRNHAGHCILNPTCPSGNLMGNSVEEMCKPKCTPEFCSRCPDAVCSATNNVIISRNCQRPCQHTVCNACYFKTKREPPCPKCAHDDFKCMEKFARCVRKDTCTRHKYPCEAHQRKKSDGRFVCKVAACL